MQNKQRFFKTENIQATNATTANLTLVHLNGRGDYAIAMSIIDKFISIQHHKSDDLARVLLSHPMCEFKRLNSDDLLTPAQYMRSVCLSIAPNILVGTLATLLNHIAIEAILKNPLHFQDLIMGQPEVLLNLQKKPALLNPWIAEALRLSLPISLSIAETRNNKTIAKHTPQPTPFSTNLMISKHQDNNLYYLATHIKSARHFNGLTANEIKPCVFSQTLISTMEQRIKAVQETIKIHQIDFKDHLASIQLRLHKYINKESISEDGLITLYTQVLSSRASASSSDRNKSMTSDVVFPQTRQTTLTDELEQAIAHAIAHGEINDFTRKLQHRPVMSF